MNKHEHDGITHFGAQVYRCKKCGLRLTREEYNETECKTA